MPESQIFNVAKMSLNVIRENKILTKVSEFTVTPQPENNLGPLIIGPYSEMPFKWCFAVEPIVACFYMLACWERISIVVKHHCLGAAYSFWPLMTLQQYSI